MGHIAIEPARPADAAGIRELLATNGLPLDGVDAVRLAYVARDAERIVGVAALEIYPDGGLLRSVAVDSSLRGTGLGARLTDAIIAGARQQRLPALFLLTTTAEGFFPRFGFRRITRDDVPASVQRSIEFVSACPASAAVMVKRL